MSTTDLTVQTDRCDCNNHGDCDFCLDRDCPALSPQAMEHFVETGCTADEPGHLSNPPPSERMINYADNEFLSQIAPMKTVVVRHDHSWIPVPNECGCYSCACGWYGRREYGGSITARATFREIKRIDEECRECGSSAVRIDWFTRLCKRCTKAGAERIHWEAEVK
jgi:hypothetical protein